MIAHADQATIWDVQIGKQSKRRTHGKTGGHTSAHSTTVSFTRKPRSVSKSDVSVTNSRQPQSLAALEYRFWLYLLTLLSESLCWLMTLRRWLTKHDQSASWLRESVTSRNMERCIGGWLWSRGYTMRRQSLPPT